MLRYFLKGIVYIFWWQEYRCRHLNNSLNDIWTNVQYLITSSTFFEIAFIYQAFFRDGFFTATVLNRSQNKYDRQTPAKNMWSRFISTLVRFMHWVIKLSTHRLLSASLLSDFAMCLCSIWVSIMVDITNILYYRSYFLSSIKDNRSCTIRPILLRNNMM